MLLRLYRHFRHSRRAQIFALMHFFFHRCANVKVSAKQKENGCEIMASNLRRRWRAAHVCVYNFTENSILFSKRNYNPVFSVRLLCPYSFWSLHHSSAWLWHMYPRRWRLIRCPLLSSLSTYIFFNHSASRVGGFTEPALIAGREKIGSFSWPFWKIFCQRTLEIKQRYRYGLPNSLVFFRICVNSPQFTKTRIDSTPPSNEGP